MRILITGSTGMVGTALKQVFEAQEIKRELLTPSKHELNVCNFDQVMRFRDYLPDVIVHLSAETDHEYCELNPANCYFINTIGTSNMVELARKLNSPIIYISTASIFDGEKREPYKPDDIPNPINHYNKSKWYGELIVQSYDKHVVLRSGWMFGGGRNIDKKFVHKIIKKIEEGRTFIKVCDDCFGSPTYSRDLADGIDWAITDIIDNGDFGTYNCVNEGGGVSRHEFALEIKKHMDSDVDIQPCKIDDLKHEFPCKRTNYEVLEMGIGLPNWKSSLKDYINANFIH